MLLNQSVDYQTKLGNVPVITSGIAQLSTPSTSGSLITVNLSGGVSYTTAAGLPININQLNGAPLTKNYLTSNNYNNSWQNGVPFADLTGTIDPL